MNGKAGRNGTNHRRLGAVTKTLITLLRKPPHRIPLWRALNVGEGGPVPRQNLPLRSLWKPLDVDESAHATQQRQSSPQPPSRRLRSRRLEQHGATPRNNGAEDFLFPSTSHSCSTLRRPIRIIGQLAHPGPAPKTVKTGAIFLRYVRQRQPFPKMYCPGDDTGKRTGAGRCPGTM